MSRLILIRLVFSVILTVAAIFVFSIVEAENPPIPIYGSDEVISSRPFGLSYVSGATMDDPNIIPIKISWTNVILVSSACLVFMFSALSLYDKSKMRFSK